MRTCLFAAALAFIVAALPSAAAAQAQPSTDGAAPATASQAPPAAELQQIYDDAYEALGRGDYAAAIDGFDRVSAESSGGLGTRAAELARFARDQQAKGSPPPSAATAVATPAADVHIDRLSEGDQPTAGRVRTIAASTVAGLYAGATLADVTDVDDARLGTLMVVGGAGAGFLGGLVATDGRRITAGMGDSFNTGIGLGLLNGFLLAEPLGLADNSEELLVLGLAGMALGGTTAMIIADRTNPTVGRASLVGTVAALGLATTALGPLVFGFEDDLSDDGYLVAITAGLDGGAIAGHLIGRDLDWSKSRSRLVALGSFLGALAGLGVGVVIVGNPDDADSTDGRVVAGSVLAGAWGGFAVSLLLTDEMAPDRRFQLDQGATVQVMPTMINRSPGVVIGGTF